MRRSPEPTPIQLLRHCASLPQARAVAGEESVHYLNGLGYVHFINLNLWKATAGHVFIVFIIAIKKVSGIHSNADGSLGQKNMQSAPSAGVCGMTTVKQSAQASDLTEARCSMKPMKHECHSSHGKLWNAEGAGTRGERREREAYDLRTLATSPRHQPSRLSTLFFKTTTIPQDTRVPSRPRSGYMVCTHGALMVLPLKS